ncbi:hypothetical protein [Dysgonomonas macrotermitis]|uniref:NinB protein n=1 Tax=Dysgonomonas macrotermitis TaxID=1346286 RepID=A0A1M5IY83_9BACT|nr:hypothetical protein [Dysgonomonas macrotermitis]SHG33328.1 hypothetical protein SAMN05444362_12157 [Dysgonomonas macrotermitis]
MLLHIRTPKDKDKVKAYVDDLKADKKYIVEVKVARERRSIDQNALYWLWLSCLMNETGENKDNLHEYFKTKFLGVDERQCFGHHFYLPNTTTKLDTLQFKNYLDRIQEFASVELGITLPDPKDLYWDEFYQQYKNFI